jgi:hypothetical protein
MSVCLNVRLTEQSPYVRRVNLRTYSNLPSGGARVHPMGGKRGAHSSTGGQRYRANLKKRCRPQKFRGRTGGKSVFRGGANSPSSPVAPPLSAPTVLNLLCTYLSVSGSYTSTALMAGVSLLLVQMSW